VWKRLLINDTAFTLAKKEKEKKRREREREREREISDYRFT
jgi:hypothetical protein